MSLVECSCLIAAPIGWVLVLVVIVVLILVLMLLGSLCLLCVNSLMLLLGIGLCDVLSMMLRSVL